MANVFTFTLEGDLELKAALLLAKQKRPLAVAQAIYEEANKIFAQSQILVPVDTGVLRGSGGVSAPQQGPSGYFVDIFYGGPAAPYALYVHEILGNYHNPPTQAKYLEQPFMASLNQLQNNIASRIIHIVRSSKGA
jgi:hypothetical protein